MSPLEVTIHLKRLKITRRTLGHVMGRHESAIKRWVKRGIRIQADAQRLRALRNVMLTSTLLCVTFSREELPAVYRKGGNENVP